MIKKFDEDENNNIENEKHQRDEDMAMETNFMISSLQKRLQEYFNVTTKENTRQEEIR